MITTEVGEILLSFLVIALIFEVALTPIFNWRWFIVKMDGKGIKTPLTLALAAIVIFKFELDILNDLLIAMDQIEDDHESLWTGKFITALLIAGGSDGFFRIFKRLGIQTPEERKNEVLSDKEGAKGDDKDE